MPLTSKGEKILGAMEGQYGPEKGEKVFYASKNKGTISGVDAMSSRPFGASDPVEDQESMLHPPELLPEPDLEHPQQHPGGSTPPETADHTHAVECETGPAIADGFAALDVNGGITGGAIPQQWGDPGSIEWANHDALPTECSIADILSDNAGYWGQWAPRPLGPDQK